MQWVCSRSCAESCEKEQENNLNLEVQEEDEDKEEYDPMTDF
jgi:hypothetical protein